MGVILSNIFLTILPQQVDSLRIEWRKVSQRCRLGCGQPKGPSNELGDCCGQVKMDTQLSDFCQTFNSNYLTFFLQKTTS